MANLYWSPSPTLQLLRSSTNGAAVVTRAGVVHRLTSTSEGAALQRAGSAHRLLLAQAPVAGAAHRLKSGMLVGGAHRLPAAQAAQAGSAHRLLLPQATQASSTHRLPAAQAAQAGSAHRLLLPQATRASSTHRLPSLLLSTAGSAHSIVYHVNARHQAGLLHRLPVALKNDALLQAMPTTCELGHAGRTLTVADAALSADEKSPHWLAAITIPHLADWAAMQVGDAITLTLGAGVWSLVIDGKTLSRASAGSQQTAVTAISPLALLDAPWAGRTDYAAAGATLASAAVAAMIGPNTWALPDWVIPPGSLNIAGATPLAAARAVVAAVGGVVESAPDGSVTCRALHPVSPAAYASATPAHTLLDDALLTTQARAAPLAGYNAVQVGNSSADTAAGSATEADALEYVVDPDNNTRGTVRAVLARPRPVALLHSGHPGTRIAAQGSVQRDVAELVEFVQGAGKTQYAVTALQTTTWQHTALGALSVSSTDPSALQASQPGYSLAQITYRTTAQQWAVSLADPAQVVQFILTDA